MTEATNSEMKMRRLVADFELPWAVGKSWQRCADSGASSTSVRQLAWRPARLHTAEMARPESFG